jgi:hypothetical protein
MFRSALLAVLAVALSSSPALAQSPLIDSQGLLALGTQLARDLPQQPDLPIAYNVVVRPSARPRSLLPLYAAQGVLHGLDVYSTIRVLENGRGREANPLFKSGSASLMIGAKIGATAIQVLGAEKLWKKHPRVAVGLMIATNVFMSGVVAHNLRLGS